LMIKLVPMKNDELKARMSPVWFCS